MVQKIGLVSQSQPFQLSFNKLLRIDFQGSRVTSDGGLILVRELDERFGLSELIGENLVDSRTGRNRQFPLADLLRQSLYSRLAGYEDSNDAARVSADPTFRLMGSEKVWERGVALTSTLHWFETDLLAREENMTGLARLNRELVAQAEGVGSPHRVVLDLDAVRARSMGSRSRAPTTGISGRSAIIRCFCLTVRETAWRQSCDPAMCTARKAGKSCYCRDKRQQQNGNEVAFRADAAFCQARGLRGFGRAWAKVWPSALPANENLERDVAELLPRPVGRPSVKPLVEYKGFLYQAASWSKARRSWPRWSIIRESCSRESASSLRT